MPAGANRTDNSRHLLITQCLQNDLFLNETCRLKLPDTVVPQMLVGNDDFDLRAGGNGPDEARGEAIRSGPLGVFLASTVGRAFAGEFTLNVINIRDWHVPGRTYDAERRAYGPHCEPGTWGVGYLEGTEGWLDPSGTGDSAIYSEKGSARIYHLRSDSLFDFRPRVEHRGEMRKFRASEFEDILDVLVQGSEEHLDRLRGLLREGASDLVHELALEVDSGDEPLTETSIYIAVIGVYTDIKVQTLLVGLRSRYDLPNLGVSDTFTASATLERHLAGLDHAVKLLDVEVIHGINDLVRFLGFPPPLEDDADLVARMSFARYRSFFQDKQNVLAFQDEKLRQYLALTERRSLDVYERIKRTNTFLIWFGCVFLGATLLLAILNAIWPTRFSWQIVAITGGIGLLQLVTAFISKPIRDLQQNLTNLAVFKMILESHSLKTALARFHLTTPHTLRELRSDRERDIATAQVEVLRQQVLAIQEFDTADFADLSKLARAIGAQPTDGPPQDDALPRTLPAED